MNTQNLLEAIPFYLEKMEELGFCENTQYMSRRITSKFKEYCLNNNIKTIDRKEIEKFYINVFDIDINSMKKGYDFVKTRPIFSLIDYYEKGYFKYSYHIRKVGNLLDNTNHISLIKDYLNEKNNLELSKNGYRRKQRVIENFFSYVEQLNINDISLLTENIIIDYINNDYALYNYKTKSCYKGIIRDFFNWLFENKKITFSGHKIMPEIHCIGRKPIENTYSKDEIKKIINSIDNSTIAGKTKLLIVYLMAYYGLRAGDVANLKYENIDFINNQISLIQCKTKKLLTLPLIDDVKYSLLDYIRCCKDKGIDNEYIIKTIHAPYRKYDENTISDLLPRIIKNSGIDINDRKTGSRIFRHTLATNMINDNVPLEKIQAILGHSNAKSTSVYVTVDLTHLKELTLEESHE